MSNPVFYTLHSDIEAICASLIKTNFFNNVLHHILPDTRRNALYQNGFRTFRKSDLIILEKIFKEEKKSNILGLVFLRNPTTSRERWMLVGVRFSKIPPPPEDITFSIMPICPNKHYII